jgi:hypothetical protein
MGWIEIWQGFGVTNQYLLDGWDDFEGGASAVVTDTGKIEST